MPQRLVQNRAKEKELGPKLKNQIAVLLSLILLAWGVGLEVPRTSSLSCDTSRTFSYQESLSLPMGESNLMLGIVEVGGGSSEMEEAGAQRGLDKGKEMYKMVKYIKLKI